MRHLLLVASIVLFAQTASAKKVTIKLGTSAPNGSTWHLLLKEMGARWAEASDGEVKLKIYAGGVAGNEGDMIRKLRIGQLHAVAVSVVGLANIITSPQAIATPGVIKGQAEWEHVFAQMQPVWTKQAVEKGYVVLGWTDIGSVHMFINKEIKTPVEMKGMKVFAWAGDPSAVAGWRLVGFQPVVLSGTDVLQALSTGMIEGFATTPLIALTARWFEKTPYMVDTAWGHLPGATIVSKKAWEKIPAEQRAELEAIGLEYTTRVNAEVSRMQSDAVEVMKKKGIRVIELDAKGQEIWTEMAEKSWPAARGGVVTEKDFDQVIEVRDAYRAASKQQGE